MALSILYCRECDVILAAAPGLHLTVDCASHSVGSTLHMGCVALRLPYVGLTGDTLDLTELSAKFPKSVHAESLEAVGNCI
jgi:hypothetical protein